MPPQVQEKRPPEQEKQDRDQFQAAIGGHVMRTLGQPGNLLRVEVRRLWEDHYRVNVFIRAEAGTSRVAHSYFLTANAEGKIVTSIPVITKQY